MTQGGLRAAGSFLGGPLKLGAKVGLGAIGVGLLPHLYKATDFISGGVLPDFGGGPQQDQAAQQTAPGTLPAPGQQTTPAQAATEQQNAAILALLERLAQQSAGLSEKELSQREALFNRLLDPGLYAERAAIDQAMWAQKQALAQQAGMEQTRELTRRKIESDTINAWRGITEAQLKADSEIARNMMNIGYAAGVPNPSVLQAGASFAQQGAAGFTAPKSQV